MSRRPQTAPVDRLPGAAAQTPAERDIGTYLRLAFAAVEEATLPAVFLELLEKLGEGEPERSAPAALGDREFKAALAAVIPHLRAFGRSLSGNPDTADDLVQETMLKAWVARDRFVAGTNMRAWTHVILRNIYFSQARRARFKGEWDEYSADLLLAIPAGQDSHVALGDMQRALMQLPAEQREALVLMGAGGMTCEEVAEICQCATGTVKSRVARARTALRALLEGGQLTQSRADTPTTDVSALDQIMDQARTFSQPRKKKEPLLLP
ncbi:sigma-70 family RNA polymerase sigma factor [Polymorphobacter fuscus]|uniref:Sigma-70 family RNA polymerase sigma factor n=1 Tax=Sandarakinorhabdus fusca TaxID=1439888 RepID=A0A7C9KYA3_9SPHN|nr:sigma-70 family RNA polymerase sigma factor [Polymorphobacter fuscus]KAB7644935.1 sigma-70 family RNA polymerase sigma factor [Polymorphobacter fuscus]MQT18222.1 sigma-70 family RNA polymerase sigma factor [Polymorphobacter fuscus]NJC09545.1 RNA polymerase sigma-70 factor (ECF subfamily) [Polymorphobacter fuscus]